MTDEDIDNLKASQKNKLVSENYVQTTLHFQKRIEKLFSLMKYDDFFGNSDDEKYHLSSYFYRIEFQARGAPHVHSLLWIKDSKNNDAPSFWSDDKEEEEDQENVTPDNIKSKLFQLKAKKSEIEKFANYLISTSPDDMKCSFHDAHAEESGYDCRECQLLKEKCKKFQTHSHTFTCTKKTKT